MRYSTISFPGLGIELNPGYQFEIGPLTFRYYGLIIAIGLLLAVIYGMRRSKQFGFTQDDIMDGVLIIVPIAVIFARAYYCIFSWEEYAANPIEVLYIWNGGLAIYGGVIGAVLGIIIYTKVKKISLPALLDLVSLGFLIGQSIGRWGNFFNREAFGEVTESFLRMGLENSLTGAVIYYHPTFLYESVWNAVGFVILHFLSKRRRYDGQIALGYVAWYGLGRAMIEGLRMDSLYWGPFRVSQVLAAVSCAAAVAVLVWQAFRPHDKAKLFVNRVAAINAAAAEAEEQTEAEEEAEAEAQAETEEIREEETQSKDQE